MLCIIQEIVIRKRFCLGSELGLGLGLTKKYSSSFKQGIVVHSKEEKNVCSHVIG